MHTLFCRCCSRFTTAKVSVGHLVGCLLRWSLGVTRRLFAASLGSPHHPKWGLFTIWGCGTRRRRRGCGWTCAGLWTTRRPQRLLYWAHMGVKLGATAAPDGEEARALFLAWEEMGPLLAYAPEDPEWQAVVAMRDPLFV